MMSCTPSNLIGLSFPNWGMVGFFFLSPLLKPYLRKDLSDVILIRIHLP